MKTIVTSVNYKIAWIHAVVLWVAGLHPEILGQAFGARFQPFAQCMVILAGVLLNFWHTDNAAK